MVAAAGGAPGRHHPHPGGHLTAHRGGRAGQRDQHRRRRAQRADVLVPDQLEDDGRIHLAQADVGARGRRHRPGVGPAVSVEHGQRPQVRRAHRHRQVQQGADGIDGGVPVRDHDALGAGRRAAGVVDRDQVALADLRPGEAGLGGGHRRLVVEPARARVPIQGHVVLDTRHPVADAVHRRQVLLGHAEHRGAGVVHDVDEVLAGQPVVDRHQHGADLRHGVEGLQLRVRVRRDRGHPVALRHAQALQCGGPPVAALEELLVVQPEVTVDDRLPVTVQPAGTAGEIQGRQWRFHACDSGMGPRPPRTSPRRRRQQSPTSL